MVRDPRTLLWDAHKRASAILEFVEGRTETDYLAEAMLRAAVERNFEVIGEALGRLRQLDPSLATKIPDLSRIVAFRNLLIHGYATVNDRIVWRTIKEDLPGLHAALSALLSA
jgi:uncharacterized protein with HEPN domain